MNAVDYYYSRYVIETKRKLWYAYVIPPTDRPACKRAKPQELHEITTVISINLLKLFKDRVLSGFSV